MPSGKLYDLCLRSFFRSPADKEILLRRTTFLQLPSSCLRDLLIYLSPSELERLDTIYHRRQISTVDLWRRHFELVWSLSRDDKDAYDSIVDIPYKRLYFEYLFHDTQILQLVIYAHVQQRNLAKSVCDLSFLEHLQYDLSRDSIIYCSKRRLTDDQEHLLVRWNSQWNIYVKRFILVPNIWNIAKIDSFLIECFTEHVTDLVLSGYPTESDVQGMKFILDVLTRGHVTNVVLKFPSYCLLNILLPLLIYPRSYALSYLCSNADNTLAGSSGSDVNMLRTNFSLPLDRRRRRQLCLHVQIEAIKEQHMPSLPRVLSTHPYPQFIDEDIDSPTDTTHAVISDSSHSLTNDSLDLLSSPPATVLPVHSSSVEARALQPPTPSENVFQTSHLIFMPDDQHLPERSAPPPYQRLLPYLNRSRNLVPFSNYPPIITSARHSSTSEQSVPSRQPVLTIPTEPLSSSDSNLFRRRPTMTLPATTQSPINHVIDSREDEENVNAGKSRILHLTPDSQTSCLTHLSLYYVSSLETIEMVAIALLGMHQVHHLTLVNFAQYSSQLETSLITLCTRSQLQSLHLTSISLVHGSIGFLLHLYQRGTSRTRGNLLLKRLRLDAIKTFTSSMDAVHLIDVEEVQLIDPSALEHLIWRERHMQYMHLRLLFKLLPNALSNLHRLELISILECNIFDQFLWCQTFLHHLPDVRLRNFRLRPVNLSRFFLSLNTDCLLTVLHFERVGLTWNSEQHSSTIQQAFTTLVLEAKHLVELSLAYNNLNSQFIQWLCRVLLSEERTSCWSITKLNLTFNLISGESMRRLLDAMKEYTTRWRVGHAPIRRLDILGNAIEMRELPYFKQQFHALGCDLTSYIFS